MKVSPKDKPVIALLVLAIAVVLVIIGYTFINHKQQVAQETPPPAGNIVAGAPKTTADLEPALNPEKYREQIEEWSKPPAAETPGNPFREVLPHGVGAGIRSTGQPIPHQIGGSSFGPGTGNAAFDPTRNGGLPDVRIDFPNLTVQGVVVDTSTGSPTNFATILVDNAPHFAKAGDVIGNDLVVEKVTLRGVQIRAAKEHAFIEISKTYRPNGIAPPAPPKAGGHRHGSRRHR